MVVKILYFASFRESIGRDEERRPLPEGARVRELWETLAREVPRFAAFPSMPPVAVNQEYTDGGTVLRDGDEVAFLPPVAGG